MKNAKYLVAIVAFATLAFVGFSAFTAPSGKGELVANATEPLHPIFGVIRYQLTASEGDRGTVDETREAVGVQVIGRLPGALAIARHPRGEQHVAVDRAAGRSEALGATVNAL